MVDLHTIRQFNSDFATHHPADLVAVFAGATNGIGACALESLVKHAQLPRFYIIGRSKTKFATRLAQLRALNARAVITFLQAEIANLKDVDAVVEEIKSREKRVDLLFMSAGLLAFGGPHYTPEKLDTCFSLSYYSRMRMIVKLLPLLHASCNPRVLSVLAGGQERRILTNDLGLTRSNAQNYTLLSVVNHTTTMHTLALEHLAKTNPDVSFVHSYPGWVQTSIVENLFASVDSSGIGGFSHYVWPLLKLLGMVVQWVVLIFGISAEEAGERQAFYAVSGRYPSADRLRSVACRHITATEEKAESVEQGIAQAVEPFARCSVPGNGVYRLTWRGEGVVEDSVLGPCREEGLTARVWEHTLEVFKQVLQ